MPNTGRSLRVLVVDDDRDVADALGLVVEQLGNQVHVTYGGTSAIDVAAVFRPDLMLIDLAMPDMDGCRLATQFLRIPAFAQTRLVAITGHADEGHKTMAMKAGFAKVLFKPVSLTDIRTVLASVVPAAGSPGQPSHLAKVRGTAPAERRLPISEARKIRNERNSRVLTEAESEAAVREGISRFQEEYLGWGAEQIRIHFIGDFVIVRIRDVLTVAERQLVKSSSPETGRELIKLIRTQLLELARPMLESMVHEIIGVKVSSMHHDVSTVTGEEVICFSLTEAPRFFGSPDTGVGAGPG